MRINTLQCFSVPKLESKIHTININACSSLLFTSDLIFFYNHHIDMTVAVISKRMEKNPIGIQ